MADSPNPPPISAPIPALDLRAQYAALRDEIRAAIEGVLESQHFILGPQGAALEREVAAYCGAAHGVGVASGTDALILALHAAGVRPGNEVIVPAFSYIATADAASLLGATPVFADIHPDTFNLDATSAAERISPRTRAIVPVHLYGQPAAMSPLRGLAQERSIALIEDNAQAIGATLDGARTGSLAELACLSFYPTKNLGGYGDGGMILCASAEMDARLRSLRGHGTRSHKYLSEEQGWNSRLDEIQAAVLRVKLRHLDAWTAARQAHAARYSELLHDVPGVTPPALAPGASHVYHQYTIRIASHGRGPARRDAVQKSLAARGIASTVYYPVPLHLQPMYASLGYRPRSLPQAELAADEVLSLPMYPELTAAQVERVAATVGEAVRAETERVP